MRHIVWLVWALAALGCDDAAPEQATGGESDAARAGDQGGAQLAWDAGAGFGGEGGFGGEFGGAGGAGGGVGSALGLALAASSCFLPQPTAAAATITARRSVRCMAARLHQARR